LVLLHIVLCMVLAMLIYDEDVISVLKRVYGDFYRDFLDSWDSVSKDVIVSILT